MIRFEVDGMPMTKGSWAIARRGKRTVLIPDNPGEVAWAELVGWSARSAQFPGTGPDPDARFWVTIEFTLDPPPNRTRKNRRDIDKLARSVLDALTGILWDDDEQVDDLTLRKFVRGDRGARRKSGALIVVSRMSAPKVDDES